MKRFRELFADFGKVKDLCDEEIAQNFKKRIYFGLTWFALVYYKFVLIIRTKVEKQGHEKQSHEKHDKENERVMLPIGRQDLVIKFPTPVRRKQSKNPFRF